MNEVKGDSRPSQKFRTEIGDLMRQLRAGKVEDERRADDRHLDCPQLLVMANHLGNRVPRNMEDVPPRDGLVNLQLAMKSRRLIEELGSGRDARAVHYPVLALPDAKRLFEDQPILFLVRRKPR